MDIKKKWKESVICLIHTDYSSYLFQLRDKKPDIHFPGHYGAFGGAIEGNETPKTACVRELEEELGFVPEDLEFFRDYFFPVTTGFLGFYKLSQANQLAAGVFP